MRRPLNFLLAGVGGQGTILASAILAEVGLRAGYEVKQAEVHGMSQRGGSVTSHVRWGDVVYAPMVGAGEVDVLLALEKLEALRALQFVRKGTLVLVNLETIVPITVTSLGQHYPRDEHLRAAVATITSHVVYMDGPGLAKALGEPKVANIVLLGALSMLLEEEAAAGETVPEQLWLDVLSKRVPPRYVDLNRRAFLAGRETARVLV